MFDYTQPLRCLSPEEHIKLSNLYQSPGTLKQKDVRLLIDAIYHQGKVIDGLNHRLARLSVDQDSRRQRQSPEPSRSEATSERNESPSSPRQVTTLRPMAFKAATALSDVYQQLREQVRQLDHSESRKQKLLAHVLSAEKDQLDAEASLLDVRQAICRANSEPRPEQPPAKPQATNQQTATSAASLGNLIQSTIAEVESSGWQLAEPLEMFVSVDASGNLTEVSGNKICIKLSQPPADAAQ